MDDQAARDRAEFASGVVIDAAMFIHSAYGPGLLEMPYKVFLTRELRLRGLAVRTEVGVPVTYRGLTLDFGFRLDLLVEDALIVEIKTVKALAPIHHAQLLSYLRLTGHRVGLLLNFHAERLKDGLKRIVEDGHWVLPR